MQVADEGPQPEQSRLTQREGETGAGREAEMAEQAGADEERVAVEPRMGSGERQPQYQPPAAAPGPRRFGRERAGHGRQPEDQQRPRGVDPRTETDEALERARAGHAERVREW